MSRGAQPAGDPPGGAARPGHDNRGRRFRPPTPPPNRLSAHNGAVDDVPLRLDFDDAEPRVFTVAPEEAGERLDRYLSARIGPLSRALVQRLT